MQRMLTGSSQRLLIFGTATMLALLPLAAAKIPCSSPGCAGCDGSDCEKCRLGTVMTARGCEECGDPKCASCLNAGPGGCDKCRSGFTFEKIPPGEFRKRKEHQKKVAAATRMPAFDKEPTFDKDGWEVEEEVSKDDWPKVCSACTTGCKLCSDPSPGSCRECFPMHELGPDGCSPTIMATVSLALGMVFIFGIAIWVTRRNFRKYKQVRASHKANKLASKAAAAPGKKKKLM